MVAFGGKKVRQMFGGNGLGHVIAAAAVTVLVRLFTCPAPAALLPESENDESCDEEEKDSDGFKAPFSGKVSPVTIRWSNITCSLSRKSSEPVKFLLKNVSGEAQPGRLLAIMGPSGSGKTMLLDVLAGQLAASPRLHLSGLVEFNGKPSSKKTYKFAYVRQEDLYFSQLTVRETLSFASELQLPGISVEERDEYVDNLLSKLDLVSCADTEVHGIGGGEKKRLNLACELIACPSVIFADEPTTGLDAFQAEKVMEALQHLAHDGHTVICSIRQPRGSVYSKLDDIILLTEGSLIYAGPAQKEILNYFSKFGYHRPDHVGPAEFLADLVSIDYSSAESVHASQKRVDGLVDSFSQRLPTIVYATPITRDELSKGGKKISRRTVAKKKRGWWKQFCFLLKRAWMQVSRDRPTNQVWAKISFTSAITLGSVFWKMGRSQTSIQDRMGLLQVAAISTAMAALTKTVGVFPKERAILDRERTKGLYDSGPYILSKLVAEIPIGAIFPLTFSAILYPMTRLHPTLMRFGKFCGIVTMESFVASAMGLTTGAIVPTTDQAMVVGPSLMTIFVVFGGYYVNPQNTPIIFHWIPRVSLIRWAFQGLCVNEFRDLQFDHQHQFDIQTGEQALERISFGGVRIKETVIAQSRILVFWYCTTYFLLKINKPKFQKFEPPLYPNMSRVKLEELDPEYVDQPLDLSSSSSSVGQVESSLQLQSPQLDHLIGPFILEGL